MNLPPVLSPIMIWALNPSIERRVSQLPTIKSTSWSRVRILKYYTQRKMPPAPGGAASGAPVEGSAATAVAGLLASFLFPAGGGGYTHSP